MDNWKHRDEGMKCRTCMWFAVKPVAKSFGPGELMTTKEGGGERGAMGRCRRHAPTMGGFPAVYESDWCGDHKIDENKI